ncbi:MAG: hypothetical protein HYR56_07765 [Acidobacteria bacterium]|nr:hypothetical protein [Acidobacteriota bacterium]MBI3427339.1 hypothetical protein [Acidobacteriota bacterium]
MRHTTNKHSPTITELLTAGVWYAEGHTLHVAELVLHNADLFDELMECLLSADNGTSKRAAMALELVSERQPAWFAPYKEILLDELAEQPRWYVLYRICAIVPRLPLNQQERARAAERLRELADSPQNALSVSALTGLTRLALRDAELREEVTWLVEQKMRTGTKGMQARCRHLLPQLYGAKA